MGFRLLLLLLFNREDRPRSDFWGDLLGHRVEVQRQWLRRCKHEHTEQTGDSHKGGGRRVREQIAILEMDVPETRQFNLIIVFFCIKGIQS